MSTLLATRKEQMLGNLAVTQTTLTQTQCSVDTHSKWHTFWSPSQNLCVGSSLFANQMLRGNLGSWSIVTHPTFHLPAAVTWHLVNGGVLVFPDGGGDRQSTAIPKPGCWAKRMEGKRGEEIKFCPPLPLSPPLPIFKNQFEVPTENLTESPRLRVRFLDSWPHAVG